MLIGRRRLRLTETECDAMRAAGRFNAQLMDYVRQYVRPGVSTDEIDRLVYDYTISHGHKPAPLNYQGFPKSCCTSVNDVICHGIPGPYRLQEGDIVNIDVTTIVDGWFGDQSETFLIGEVSKVARRVTQCSFDCLWAAIDNLHPGCPVSAIGEAIVQRARKYNFGVVEEYVGHGVGRALRQKHNIPRVPTAPSRRERLGPGICFTIEPMINSGSRLTVLDERDGWTVTTKDGGLSAQFEHTLLMTAEGPEVLTLTMHGPQKGHKF